MSVKRHPTPTRKLFKHPQKKDGIQEAENQVIGQDLELEWDVLKTSQPRAVGVYPHVSSKILPQVYGSFISRVVREIREFLVEILQINSVTSGLRTIDRICISSHQRMGHLLLLLLPILGGYMATWFLKTDGFDTP